jgi:hypothetical protein
MRNGAPALGAALLLGITAGTLGLPASASGSAASASAVKKPKPSPSPSPAPSGTFVKAYAGLVNGFQLSLTALDVQATSDGGYVALAEAQSPTGLGVDWLVKPGANGAPQWQEQVGCASPQGAPGDYADGVSVQQTADGGYVLAGQTIDCGSGSSCPPLSGRSCALAEKLDAAGRLTWARVYAASLHGSVIDQIRPAADGGYIAAGSVTDSSQYTGALLLKLDSAGNVQWQKDLGPAGTTSAYFNSVQQTADGGYVAAGAYYTPASGPAPTQVLVARFAAGGSLAWQHGLATPGSSGTPTSVADASSIIQTPDGGYAVAGRWYDQAFNGGNGAQGALLLKLDPAGILQWQKAYSGGCYLNGYNTCTNLGAVSYSLHQTSDGGYVMAGSGDLELTTSVYLVPWLAKTDADGNLLWQHLYYQASAEYGTPLSEDFQASALAPGGGFLATGPTLDDSTQKDELYVVRTDGSGLAGTCNDVHPATPLQAISPQLTAAAPSLPLSTATTHAASSPIGTLPASSSTHQDC